jgi:dUTP pyrophosphatase
MKIHQLPHAVGLSMPLYATKSSAGADLRAAIWDNVIILPGDNCAIPTGNTLELPDGVEGQIRPRSGIALHHNVTVLNAPGTIDSDYRGEIVVILINHGPQPFIVTRGMRIAQLVIAPYYRLDGCDPRPDVIRGTEGFGSSGTH